MQNHHELMQRRIRQIDALMEQLQHAEAVLEAVREQQGIDFDNRSLSGYEAAGLNVAPRLVAYDAKYHSKAKGET